MLWAASGGEGIVHVRDLQNLNGVEPDILRLMKCACGQRELSPNETQNGGCGCGGKGRGGHGHGHGGGAGRGLGHRHGAGHGGCGCGSKKNGIEDRSEGRTQLGLRSS